MILPVTNQGYQLMHEGAITLAQVEANGMKIDENYLASALKDTKNKIKKLEFDLMGDKIYKIWKKEYGRKFNLQSRMQLGKILFDRLDYPCKIRTSIGNPKVDEMVLAEIDLPFIQNLIQIEKLKKARGTYLMGIQRETINGFIHPVFNLHMVQTFRSSSDSPNFQNIPVRNPEIKKLIRQCFIARKNHRIIETDYNGAEIGCAAGYHRDPMMISYISDSSKDLHSDMAAQIFMLSEDEVPKDVRYCGKNMFIFPQFYGDWYLSNAKSLWNAIVKMKLKTADGMPMKKWLRKNGIKRLGACNPQERPIKGTFENHLKEVENDFWNNRFKVYGQWKEDWWKAYQRNGYFITQTGFMISGVYNRKEVINYPIQGSAFHWLLWSLIRINKLLKKYKMISKLVGQIHDSIVADVHKKEKKQYLEIVQKVMTQDVKKHWSWINVPLSIEAEVTPVGGSWYQKKEIVL